MAEKEIKGYARRINLFLEKSKGRSCSYKELKDVMGISSRSLNQAIGWLSHERQIIMDDKSEFISLPNIPFF